MTTNDILKDYIIYKIYCKNKEITDEYYGHTSAFRNRKYKHKGNCNNEHSKEYNLQIYQFIRLNGGWDNWEMSPIEEIKNCSLVNARIREQFHIDLNKSIMNTRKSYITEEEKITCACGKTFARNTKLRHERSQFHFQFIQSAI
jgi:hypothetical protein